MVSYDAEIVIALQSVVWNCGGPGSRPGGNFCQPLYRKLCFSVRKTEEAPPEAVRLPLM